SGRAETPVPLALSLACAAAAGGIVAAAVRARPAAEAGTQAAAGPAAWRLRLVGALGSFSWFAVRIFVVGDGQQLPAAAGLVAWPLLALLVTAALRSGGTAPWPPSRVYTLAASALPASWLFGVLIVAVSSPVIPVDLAGHLLFGAGFLFMLRRVRRR